MKTISLTVFFLCIIFLFACKKEMENPNILLQLAANYEQLPEQEIAISSDGRVYAQYAMPTERYQHGIMGDKIEAGQLVVMVDGVFYEWKLSGDFVFEDIRPRLYDVDSDGALEFITIRTHISKGAGIAIYKILNEQLIEYAHVEEIGTPNRWLNIVAINDLDNDENVELVWIQTPHIGGILKVAKIQPGVLQVLDETSLYSNHEIGQRNLCLSVLTEQFDKKVFYVPNQNRNKIVGFTFENDRLQIFEEIDQSVDFSNTLFSQFNFGNAIEEEDNCINP